MHYFICMVRLDHVDDYQQDQGLNPGPSDPKASVSRLQTMLLPATEWALRMAFPSKIFFCHKTKPKDCYPL